MIEPTLTLALNLMAKPGVYALLLGSGVSRSAKIPTGWEVTLDLVRKLATAAGDDCSGEEEKWFYDKYGSAPEYSSLVSKIARTSAAQQSLLRSYFERNGTETDDREKKPTDAHRAIARLVAKGFVRVIVSTNFDRLLEQALEAEGIAPVVIASADAIKGAPPLAHSPCTIFKVHGDFLDARIRNSPEALEKYGAETNRLLSQIFDEYGLVVCGWSAEYDTALRRLLAKTKARRYPIYWTSMGKLSAQASDLTRLLNAEVISGITSDQLFTDLANKVEALDGYGKSDPLSEEAAVAELRHFLSDPNSQIRYRELMVSQAKNTSDRIRERFLELPDSNPTWLMAHDVVRDIDFALGKMRRLVADAVFYTRIDQIGPIVEALKFLAPSNNNNGFTIWVHLQRYPLLQMLYVVGIFSIASQNYGVLNALVSQKFVPSTPHEKVSPALTISPSWAIDGAHQKHIFPKYSSMRLPLNYHFRDLLAALFNGLGLREDDYSDAFDSFEYLWSLIWVDSYISSGLRSDPWVPPGLFVHSKIPYSQPPTTLTFMDAVDAGLFGGERLRLQLAKSYADPKFLEYSRLY